MGQTTAGKYVDGGKTDRKVGFSGLLVIAVLFKSVGLSCVVYGVIGAKSLWLCFDKIGCRFVVFSCVFLV